MNVLPETYLMGIHLDAHEMRSYLDAESLCDICRTVFLVTKEKLW